MAMTSRERVLSSINHEEPDRVPIIIGVSNATSMKMNLYRSLKRKLGVYAQDRYLYDWLELGTADIDEQTLQRLKSDVRGVTDRIPETVSQRNQARPPHTPSYDDWGIGHEEIEPGVWYPNIHPLSQANTIQEIDTYSWPDMDDPSRLNNVRDRVRQLHAENQYAIMGTPWLLFPLERAFGLQGMDQFLTNMALEPEFAQELLKKITDLCKSLMGNFLRETGEYLDIIKIGDDLGMQDRLMISPQMYRKFLKPVHSEYISFIKNKTDAKLFFHTDGDIYDLLDDFVEIGVDILNPIQTHAGRLGNLADLKKRYGKRLSFCGAIDTQQVLPFGNPQQVREEVRRVIKEMAPGGGYLLAAVHTITDQVPVENVIAMIDAVEEYGYYPIAE